MTNYYGSSNETSVVQAKQLSLKPAAACRAVSRHPTNAGLPRRGEHGSLTRLTGSKVSRNIRSICISRRISSLTCASASVDLCSTVINS